MSVIAFAEGIWLDTIDVRYLGLRFRATMAVLRLADDSLVLYSPVTMTPERRSEVEALGRIAHLYAPNTFHHSFIGPWATAFPSARVHAPRGLIKKRPDLRIDRVCDGGSESEPAFAGAVDELRIDGFRLEESVLFHRASRTLVVADLVQNLGRVDHLWTRIYTTAMGFYDRVALSRMIRWTGFPDHARTRRSVDAVLALPIQRVVVGHGAPLVDDARRQLADACAWIR